MMNDLNSSCMQGKFATRVGQVLRECDSDEMLPKQQQNPAEDNFTRIIPRRFTSLPPPTTTQYPFCDCPPPVLLRQIARCCSIRTSSRLWHRDYRGLLIIHQLLGLISGKHRRRVPTERASTLEVHLRLSVKWHRANKTLKDLRSWSVAEVRHTWYLLLALTVMMRHY